MRRNSGTFVEDATTGERVRAFLPAPLPPAPAAELSTDDQILLSEANRSLGRLDVLTTLLPDTSLFIYFYVRKEAVLSSQIEGTQSSLSDLLMYESSHAPNVPINDVEEVSQYVAAMRHGLERINGGFPLSSRLLREIHGILLSSGRGHDKTPGEYRRTQNWIGGERPGNALFVPPPPRELSNLMGNLERFLHDEYGRMPLLMKAAIAHVQFETIHPFLDGNGRLGRLLITLLLCAEKALAEPTLYLSLYFKRNRETYYSLLQSVREDGDFEAWIRFFLEGVRDTAEQAVGTARRILDLFTSDQMRINTLGRKAPNVLRVHQHLQRHPVADTPGVSSALSLSYPTVGSCLAELEQLGLVREVTGKKRDRVWVYSQYISLLAEGTEAASAAS